MSEPMVGVITNDPILVGLVVGIPTAVLGALGYRRSAKLDRVATATAGVALQSAETRAVSEGQSGLIASLQNDNRELRTVIGELRTEITDLKGEVAAVRTLLESK